MVSSPAQRLMNRRTKTLLPTTQCLLLPKVTSPEDKKENLRHRQQTQAKYYNSSAKDLPSRSEGDVVRMKPFKLSDKSWCKTFVASALISKIIHCWNARRCYIPQEQAAIHLKKTSEPASIQQDSSPSSPEESNQSRACEDLTHQEFQARAPATYQWRSSRHSQLVRQTTQSSWVRGHNVPGRVPRTSNIVCGWLTDLTDFVLTSRSFMFDFIFHDIYVDFFLDLSELNMIWT